VKYYPDLLVVTCV